MSNIIEQTNNILSTEILDLYELLTESVRHYFSRLCNGNEYQLNIDIEGTQGLSELDKIQYLKVIEQPGTGEIYFQIGNSMDKDSIQEHHIDNLMINELVYIIDKLN